MWGSWLYCLDLEEKTSLKQLQAKGGTAYADGSVTKGVLGL